VDGFPQLFAANSLAPLVKMPKRLVYLSSGAHYGAGNHFSDPVQLSSSDRSTAASRHKQPFHNRSFREGS
jgi:hypothetical protein